MNGDKRDRECVELTFLQLFRLLPIGFAHSRSHTRPHALQVSRELCEGAHYALLSAGRARSCARAAGRARRRTFTAACAVAGAAAR